MTPQMLKNIIILMKKSDPESMEDFLAMCEIVVTANQELRAQEEKEE